MRSPACPRWSARSRPVVLALRSSLLLGLSLPATAGDGGAPPEFDHRALEGFWRFALTAADWDGDGRGEGAVASWSGGVVPLLSDASGALVEQPLIFDGYSLTDLTTADVDGDGAPDLLGVSASDDVLVWAAGHGDGTFGAVTEISIPESPLRIVAGDFDQDGDVDVVTVNGVDWSLSVFEGQVLGELGPPVQLELLTDPRDVALCDLDGNGLSDLVIVTQSGWVYTALGQHGNFDLSVASTLGEVLVAVDAGDFDGDGFVDVAVLGERLYVLRGAGDGTLAAPVHVDVSAPFEPIVEGDAIAALDLDGDGRSDLAVAHSLDQFVTLRGLPGGGFQAGEEVDVAGAVELKPGAGAGLPELWSLANDGSPAAWRALNVLTARPGGSLLPPQVGAFSEHIAAVDLDGDGREELFGWSTSVDPDAAVESWTATVQKLGPGGVYSTLDSATFTGFLDSVDFGDIDADGDVDVLLNVRQAGVRYLRVLRNAGDGLLPGPETFQSLDTAFVGRAVLTHIDQDGLPDCVATRSDGLVLYAFRNLQGQLFSAPVTYGCGTRPEHVAVGDLDGDGLEDAVTDVEEDSLWVYLGQGGGYAPGVELTSIGGNHPVLGDFDGDGNLDCAVRGGGALHVLFGRGDGTFEPAVLVSGPAQDAQVGDVDGDGIDDVISPRSGGVTVVYGRSDRALEELVVYPEGLPLELRAVALDDLDSDGRIDFLAGLRKSASDAVSPSADGVYALVNRAEDPAGLYIQTEELSVSAGGVQQLELCAGPDHAGLTYWVLGSISGTSPGIDFGTAVLPLVPDAYFVFTLGPAGGSFLVDALGVLGPDGTAQAANVVPAGTDPALIGAEMFHAYLAADLVSGLVTYTSAPVPLRLVP